MNEFFMSKRLERSPTDPFNLGINTHHAVDLNIVTEEILLINIIHAKFYANSISNYNVFKMNTQEFNKLLGFEAGAAYTVPHPNWLCDMRRETV